AVKVFKSGSGNRKQGRKDRKLPFTKPQDQHVAERGLGNRPRKRHFFLGNGVSHERDGSGVTQKQVSDVVPHGGRRNGRSRYDFKAPEGDRDVAEILLAEDDEAVREFVSRALSYYGHQVTAVPDGGAALEALEKSPYDLMLTDIVMPGLDGIALALK